MYYTVMAVLIYHSFWRFVCIAFLFHVTYFPPTRLGDCNSS